MKKSMFVIIAVILGYGLARSADWVPIAGGEYNFTDTANWKNGSYMTSANTRTTGQTGDQTICVPSPLAIGQFYPGASDTTTYWQIFTGASLTPNSNFRVMGGNVVFENEVVGQLDNWIGLVYPTRLVLRNGGSLTIKNSDLSVGRPYNATLAGDAAVFLEEGGTLHLTAGRPMLLQTKNGSYETHSAYFRQDGGTFRSDSTSGNFLRVGTRPQNYAQYDFLGGTISLATNTTDSQNIQVGSWGLNASAYWEGNSGHPSTNFSVQVGLWDDGVQGGHSELTIANGGYLRCKKFHTGYRGAGNTAILNLNEGGELRVDTELSVGNNGNDCWMNFNGGKLTIPNRVSNWGAQNGRTVFYPGGGTFDMGNSGSVTKGTSFRSAGGYGVESISLNAAGSGYVAAPMVTITGGSGSNATAVAIVNHTGAIERLVLTCRGEGYAADDVLTVSFASKSGSGAAASVTLSENTPGTWTSTCDYNMTWTQNATNFFDGNLRIQRGYVNLDPAGSFPELRELELSGGQFTEKQTITENSLSTNTVLVFSSADRETAYRFGFAKTAGATNRQELATLLARDGLGRIYSVNSPNDDTEGYALRFRNYEREYGLVDISTNSLLSVTLDATDHLSSSTVSPVVNGLFNLTDMLLFERGADGSLSIAPKTTTFAEDANYIAPQGTTRQDATAVNSVFFTSSGEQQLYLNRAGNVEIKSGMILGVTTGNQSVLRLVNENGGITTRVPGGMVILEKNTESRIGYNNRRFLMGGPFVDPDSETPMQVTLAGVSVDASANGGRAPNLGTPQKGALIWMLSENNTFSGGLNLIHAGLVIRSDASLGAAGKPLRVSGNSAIANYYGAINLAANRPIEIHRNGSFQLQPWNATAGRVNTIAGPLSGEGAILLGYGEYTEIFVLSGDQSSFTGNYYVCNAVRGNNFSPHAKIHLCAAAMKAYGTIQTSGTFNRPFGTGKGQVSWTGHAAYNNVQGGFSAYGGDLTVNLGGNGAVLKHDSSAFPSNSRLVLQDALADGNLTFENDIDLNGTTLVLLVWQNKTATLAGDILNNQGDASIYLRSEGTLEFAGHVASNVVINGTGKLAVAAGNTLEFFGTNTYTGTTTIPAGAELRITGAHTNCGAYAVSGTLGGDAVLTPTTASTAFSFADGSILAPGSDNNCGTLAFGEEEHGCTFSADGTTFQMDIASAANHDAVTVVGDAQLSGTLRFEISATAETLRSLQRTVLPLVTFANAPTGTFSTEVDLEDWRVVRRDNALCLIYGRSGTVITIR
ncbi:MAG: hypothetical protein IKR48_10010 [Kiritimatiellae bacterium]|nr:hypothetical protein [Kiritimatiellia bacterium]